MRVVFRGILHALPNAPLDSSTVGGVLLWRLESGDWNRAGDIAFADFQISTELIIKFLKTLK